MSTTVAVCTRNRSTTLDACLRTLSRLDPAADVVLVVDQSDPEEASRVRALCRDGLRYVPSPARGLGFARQVALDRCETDVLLFTDDDCLVRPGWAGALAAVFAVHPDAGAASGAVRPHPSHPLPPGIPEWVSDWGNGSTRVFRGPRDPATVGGGLNLAFRTEVIRSLGGFDVELGAGAPLRSSEDADAIHRVLRAGFTVVYTPEAVVSHRPPRDLAAHEANERDYAFGLGAWAAKSWCAGDPLPRRWWREGLARTLTRAVRCAPFDGLRATRQRLRVAAQLVRGWRAGSARGRG